MPTKIRQAPGKKEAGQVPNYLVGTVVSWRAHDLSFHFEHSKSFYSLADISYIFAISVSTLISSNISPNFANFHLIFSPMHFLCLLYLRHYNLGHTAVCLKGGSCSFVLATCYCTRPLEEPGYSFSREIRNLDYIPPTEISEFLNVGSYLKTNKNP